MCGSKPIKLNSALNTQVKNISKLYTTQKGFPHQNIILISILIENHSFSLIRLYLQVRIYSSWTKIYVKIKQATLANVNLNLILKKKEHKNKVFPINVYISRNHVSFSHIFFVNAVKFDWQSSLEAQIKSIYIISLCNLMSIRRNIF